MAKKNIFSGLGDFINSLKPNPENVALREATKQARIEAQYAYKNAKLDSGLTQDNADFWQGIGDRVYTTADPLSQGGFFREVYENTHDSAHAAGSGLLGAFGVDAKSGYQGGQGTINANNGATYPASSAPMSAPPSTGTSAGMDTNTMVMAALGIGALVLLSRNNK